MVCRQAAPTGKFIALSTHIIKVSPKETRRKKEKLNIITQKKGNEEKKSIAWERKNRGKTKNTKAGFWKR